ncbi:MAG: hypothetical protein RLY20_185 [Verrucomicrobiota bacterium]|jgi:hypothetical protein
MKKALKNIIGTFVFTALAFNLKAQLFQQDFSTSTNLADYISATAPNSGQFNSISTSGAAVTVAIVSNALQYVRTSGNSGSFSRTNEFAGPPAAVVCKFDLTVLGNGSSSTSVATWLWGAGFGTANSADANAKVHSRFSINVPPRRTSLLCATSMPEKTG